MRRCRLSRSCRRCPAPVRRAVRSRTSASRSRRRGRHRLPARARFAQRRISTGFRRARARGSRRRARTRLLVQKIFPASLRIPRPRWQYRCRAKCVLPARVRPPPCARTLRRSARNSRLAPSRHAPRTSARRQRAVRRARVRPLLKSIRDHSGRVARRCLRPARRFRARRRVRRARREKSLSRSRWSLRELRRAESSAAAQRPRSPPTGFSAA